MTTQEFKQNNPQYDHLEGNELWNKMEEAALRWGWAADYSEGIVEELSGIINGLQVIVNSPTHWIHEITRERITNDEMKSRCESKFNNFNPDNLPLESFKFEILDFGEEQ